MADYSAMKSCLKKNNLQYFTFPPHPEKPIKAVTRPFPPGYEGGRYFQQP
jgi:hypothetical protein